MTPIIKPIIKPIFKAILDEAIATGDQANIDAMKVAIEQEIFFVEVIVTGIGQYSMGSTSVDVEGKDTPIPCVYATQAEVLAEIKDETQRYESEVQGGERDVEDEYEGQLMAMKWDGGTQVSFFDVDDLDAKLDEGAWRWHAGH